MRAHVSRPAGTLVGFNADGLDCRSPPIIFCRQKLTELRWIDDFNNQITFSECFLKTRLFFGLYQGFRKSRSRESNFFAAPPTNMFDFYFGAGEAVLFGQSDCLTAARLKNTCGIDGFHLFFVMSVNDSYHFDSLQAQV